MKAMVDSSIHLLFTLLLGTRLGNNQKTRNILGCGTGPVSNSEAYRGQRGNANE